MGLFKTVREENTDEELQQRIENLCGVIRVHQNVISDACRE